MYTSTFLISLLSATTAIAVPHLSPSNAITVILSNQATELGSQTLLADGKLDEKSPVGSFGPFKTVQIKVPQNTKNKDIRCQVLDKAGNAIEARRDPNQDITFSDGGKGEWTFLKDSEVSKIICNPLFQKRPPPPSTPNNSGEQIQVLLANQAIELGQNFILKDPSKRQELAVRQPDPFSEVTLTAPASAKDLRCQLQDMHGKNVTLQRNQNIDVTFADGGNGKWTFKDPKEAVISKIICDPIFKKASA